MPVQITVQGEEFRRFQAKLKTLDKDIQRAVRKEMNTTIRAAGQRVVGDVKGAAASDLPKAGGLAARVAARPVKVSVTQRAVTIRVIGMDAKSTNRGKLRHPVYARPGQPRTWVSQAIRPGWFTRQMEKETPTFRVAIMIAVEQGLRRVEGL